MSPMLFGWERTLRVDVDNVLVEDEKCNPYDNRFDRRTDLENVRSFDPVGWLDASRLDDEDNRLCKYFRLEMDPMEVTKVF